MDQSQLIKGVLPTAVLALIARGDSHGYSILRSLRAAGFESIGDASVYGTLRRLYAEGWLSTRNEPSERGPARKCYSLTDDGQRALASGLTAWVSFRESVDQLVHTQEEVIS